MTKDQKRELVEELAEQFRQFPNFYIIDTQGFSVIKDNTFRRKCFENNLRVRNVKNTLIKKSLEALGTGVDYSELFDSLKGSSSIIFVTEANNTPAKLIKDFRKDDSIPAIKVAFIEESTYVGDHQIDALIAIKSKNDLIGEIVGLLQSPAKNVVSALKSPAGKLAGILKTLEDRG